MKKLTLLLAACVLLTACADKVVTYDLVPYPNELTPQSGAFALAGADFTCDELLDADSRAVVEGFAARLAQTSGCGEVSYAAAPEQANGFRFVVDASLPAEHYKLDVERRRVTVRASSLAGFLYAVQTIKQLLPASVFGYEQADGAAWTLPCVSITDSPRFGYRGLMLDVARHFYDVDQVKKVIDVMVMHKLNTLHWHLSDDQGWRIEIKRYPELTTYGSIRKKTMIRKEWDNYDNTPYGGYYTQDQIREVVRYAAERAVTVIPEIDLPGHMMAALACYPDLGCTGGPYEVSGQWGVRDDVLCPGKEKTFGFIEDVLTEVMELFPSKYIHIGGDECPKVRWEKCHTCQARIRELGLKGDDKHTAEYFLQSYVTARVEKFLNDNGRRIIGWDEILEGELAPNATVMSWRGSEGGIEAAKQGHDAIMTPTTHFYFDYYQAREIDQEPFGIGGYVPIEKVYGYEPLPDSLDPGLIKHILGVQANLWTEYITTSDHLEYMLLPRMAALSEVQWCRPERKAWPRFLSSLSHIVSIYDAMGFNYAKAVFGVLGEVTVNADKGCVEVSLSTQGDAPIRYTLDGSEPTDESLLYSAPIEVRGACTVKARAMRENMQTRTWSREFIDNKAMGCKAVSNTAPTSRYAFSGAQLLVDGSIGGHAYADGAWVGWLDEPLDVTLDMNGQTYSAVSLGCLVQKGSWLFPPVSLLVSTSNDNLTFAKVGMLEFAPSAAADPDGRMVYRLAFPETSARYLRVEAQSLVSIPAWHEGKGHRAHLFTDEILVE